MRTNQNKWTSLVEAHLNAIIGAPLAIGAHIMLLTYFKPEPGDYVAFAAVSWPIFFYISVIRLYFFRRLFEKYKFLDPVYTYRYMKKKKKRK